MLKEIDDWYSVPENAILERLGASPETGLTQREVAARRARYGHNRLTAKRRKSAAAIFLMQFNQALVYILLAAGTVTLLLKEYVDASVIFGVVLVNAIIGFIQETKAARSLEALARAMVTRVRVLRNGAEGQVSSGELVPGDIVMVTSGDKVAADMRLLAQKDLKVNESALTGESLAVEKEVKVLPEGTALADRVNALYASTLVTYGRGTAVVVTIGDATEVGKISGLVQKAEENVTPLTKKIAGFSRVLLIVILGMAAATFAVGLLRGQNWVEMFMASVALAVGAIPEGLPAAVTITLAIGVSRMAARRAIIRRLPAVETLGSTTVICTDKTGTLTENQMTVKEIHAGSVAYALTGGGYNPEGSIQPRPSAALMECLRAGLLSNESRITQKEGLYDVVGDPTEGALIASAAKAGLAHDAELREMPMVDILQFESQRQYMATLHAGGKTGKLVYVKGSAEKLLERCSAAMDDDGNMVPLDRETVQRKVAAMAAQGLRVLAFARKPLHQDMATVGHHDLASDLEFLGLQGMMDPPRAEAIAAVMKCHSAGIRVKMITGDHALTARSIAAQVGLDKMPGVRPEALEPVTGAMMERFSEEDFLRAADESLVFARATPEQKLRLVKALQSRNNIVAMTGDGVNDAPALKQADIGVSMGITGTEVAKEAADMVLTDDNFASIEAAVEEGRAVFDNLRKFIIWTLPTNLGEGLAILAAIFAGTALPILPVQILWVNMTTAILLGLMLAFEPKEPGIMRRPPLDPSLPIMTRELIFRILLVGVLLLVCIFGLFEYELRAGATLAGARTVAVAALVMGELFYLFNCRTLERPVFSVGLFSNKWVITGCAVMIAAQLLFTYAPVMNRLFQTEPIGGGAWARVVGAGFLVLLIVALEKWVRLRLKKSESAETVRGGIQ